jgi:hypothetical protein
MTQTSIQFYVPLIWIFCLFGFGNLACTQSAPPKSPTDQVFHYDVNQIEEITLGKLDPNTGEQWMTSIHRTDPNLAGRSRRLDRAKWEFTSLPDGSRITDLKANSIFIMHLLDSLRSLRKTGEAPHGSLESLGLAPPLYVLRLKFAGESLEFRIGNSADHQRGQYFTEDLKQVIVADGSFLKMLPLITDFEKLRDQSWSSMTTDDVDEFTISKRGKPIFYAQREGSSWTDQKHRPIELENTAVFKQNSLKDAESLLKSLTELRPKGLKDDLKLREHLGLSKSFSEIQIMDRHGATHSLKLVKTSKNLFGLSTARPSAVFILDPRIWKIVESVGTVRQTIKTPQS